MVPHPPGSPHFPYTTLFRSYGRAVRLAMAYADTVNQAFDAAKPWVMAKGISTADDTTREQLQDICSRALAGFKALTVMLAPILPELSHKVAHDLFGDTPYQWADAAHLPTRIAPFKHLMQRVDAKMLDALFEAPEEPAATPGGE